MSGASPIKIPYDSIHNSTVGTHSSPDHHRIMVFGPYGTEFWCPCLPGVSLYPFTASTLSNLHRTLISIPNIGPVFGFPRGIVTGVFSSISDVCGAQKQTPRPTILTKLWINFAKPLLDLGSFNWGQIFNLRPAKVIIDPIVFVETIILSLNRMARLFYTGKIILFSITSLRLFYSILDYRT